LDFFLVILKLQGGPKSDEIWYIFRPRPQTFCSHARTRKNIVIPKKVVTHRWLLYTCATFCELGVQTPRDPRAILLFLRTNRLGHVLFPFARWQHCWYAQTALCIRRTRTLCIRRTLCRHVTVFDGWYTTVTLLVQSCDNWYTNGHFCCFDCLVTIGTLLVQSW